MAYYTNKITPSGVTKEEIRAIIHVVGIYCGVPQSLECFRVAKKVLEEKNMLQKNGRKDLF